MGQRTVGAVQKAIRELRDRLRKEENREPTREEIDQASESAAAEVDAERVNWEEFKRWSG